MWVGGIYENDYVLEGGTWKISNIHFFEQYRGLYEEPGQKGANVQIPYHFTVNMSALTIPASAVAAHRQTPERLPPIVWRALRPAWNTWTTRIPSATCNHAYGYYLDRKHWGRCRRPLCGGWQARKPAWQVLGQNQYSERHSRRSTAHPHLRYGELFDHLNFETVVTISTDGRHAAARTVELAQIGPEQRVRPLGTRRQ